MKEGVKLTQSQHMIWMGQKMYPNSPMYNVAHSFTIYGTLDVVSFKRAFATLVAKVAAFKTIFGDDDGIPYQTFVERDDYDLEILDFSAKEKRETVSAYLKERTQRILDLHKMSFDSVLLRVSDEEYTWFLNLHHSVSDATSSTIIYDNLVMLYKAIKSGSVQAYTFPPSFKTYLELEAKNQEDALLVKGKQYWKTKVESAAVPPKLFLKEVTGPGTNANRVTVALGDDRIQKIKALGTIKEFRCWNENMLFFNVIATVLFVYLKRISNQNNLTIGSPSHGRTSRRFKKTIGLFIAFFPLSLNLEEADTFQSAFDKLRTEALEYLKNAQPGMTNAQIGRSFNVVLNYINSGFKDFGDFKMRSNWIHPDHCDPAHHLRLHVYDMDQTGEISLLFDFNEHIFNAQQQQEVPEQLLRLLDAFLENPNQPIGKPSLVPKTAVMVPRLRENDGLVQKLRSIGNGHQEKTAISFSELTMSYGELRNTVGNLIKELRQKGLQKGDRIALYQTRSPEYLIGLFACFHLGVPFVPIPADTPKQRLKFILKDSSCALVLTNGELANTLEAIHTEHLVVDCRQLQTATAALPRIEIQEEDLAYILYTSGSTGTPKGVKISHGALANYLNWACGYYDQGTPFVFPLFTSIGFDLTITSTFLPFLTGGHIVIYKETIVGPDVALLDVLSQNAVNSIKLTPSHLALVQGMDHTESSIKTIVVGGEAFKTDTARAARTAFGTNTRIFNEYGPTEATVGCVVSEFKDKLHTGKAVPIGKSISNMGTLVLDDHGNPVPQGVAGELHVYGKSLSHGYLNLPELTKEKFIYHPLVKNTAVYATGDLVRYNDNGELEYLGRQDEQVKLQGFRIDLGDIEANMVQHESVDQAAVVVWEEDREHFQEMVENCKECGLPSNYPNADFDTYGVCHLCTSFKGYKEKTDKYFKTEKDLKELLLSKINPNKTYDCLSLLSGGKDSTYVLARLVNMGLRVLTFTLDNGYISDQAKDNINTIVKNLGVDHIYGSTEHMNAIFVDSLQRHQNVCNGCFKTIYTLSTQIALDKGIPFVVTGLSRGQFFETRLTEELFWEDDLDGTTIDDIILEARKTYHQEEDAVKTHLDTAIFQNSETFEKVTYVDFYRYCDVSLEEMLRYLKEKVGWKRPTDTGRSTNCLINQLGIHVHKKQKGYSNYSFPYSWDVRLGHKNRDEALEEINEAIDEPEVKKMMREIGYEEPKDQAKDQKRLVAYYTSAKKIATQEFRTYLGQKLQAYMIPSLYKKLEEIPLTSNGKIDKEALKRLDISQLQMETPYVAPQNEIQELMVTIWKEVLQLKQVGVQDNFIGLGGHSLAAIRVTSRVHEQIELKLPLHKVFELPTIQEYAGYLEKTILELLEK